MMNIEEFRRAGYAVIDSICDYYESIESRPVVSPLTPGDIIRALPKQAPEKGQSFDLIAKDVQDLILPGITNWQHPSFFAYFSCNASFPGILGDLWASALTNPGFNWNCSPAATELENVVMDWAADLLGLDPIFKLSSGSNGGGGVIQATACDSVLVALISARSQFYKAHAQVYGANAAPSMNDLVIYVSTQTHSLGVKAARIMGVRVRVLEVREEDEFSLRGQTVKAAYDEDRRLGRWPFFIVATQGTTSSGAVDCIDEIGAVIASLPSRLYMHIDAAWAGVFLACPEYRPFLRLDAINKYADSFCTNFHKAGLVNLDCATMWVRNRREMNWALDVTPEFLRTAEGDEGVVIEYRNWQLPLSRRFRSIKFWFVLRSYGKEGFRAHLHKAVSLGGYFTKLVQSTPILELVAPPSLSLNVVRLVPPPSIAADLKTINALNVELHKRLNSGPDPLFLTRTDLNGKLCIRMAIGAERTQQRHVLAAFELIRQVGGAVLAEYVQSIAQPPVTILIPTILTPTIAVNPSPKVISVTPQPMSVDPQGEDRSVLGKRRRRLTATLLVGPRVATRMLRSASCSEGPANTRLRP